MGSRELIAGPNFSGRSRTVHARAQSFAAPTYFIGPYAEAALSGLSSTIADEIELYRAKDHTTGRSRFGTIPTDPRRKPQTLSGGEQVLLALHCFSLSGYRRLPSTLLSSSSMPAIDAKPSTISMPAIHSTWC